MTDDITSPSDLKDLSEKELWKIAVDDDHPGQLAAQTLLEGATPEESTETSASATENQTASPSAGEAEDRPLSEICDSIANADDVSDRMQEVAARIRDGIHAGEIDAQ